MWTRYDPNKEKGSHILLNSRNPSTTRNPTMIKKVTFLNPTPFHYINEANRHRMIISTFIRKILVLEHFELNRSQLPPLILTLQFCRSLCCFIRRNKTNVAVQKCSRSKKSTNQKTKWENHHVLEGKTVNPILRQDLASIVVISSQFMLSSHFRQLLEQYNNVRTHW